MDWKSNAWVGVAAAVVLVLFIVVMFWYAFRGGEDRMAQAGGEKFQCEACGGVFEISRKDMLEDDELYNEYWGKDEEPLLCQLCGAREAYWVYYCPKCDKYYKYLKSQRMSSISVCPEGHIIAGAEVEDTQQ